MRTPDDFNEEIRAHIELEADRLRAEGLSDAQAHAAARRTFGNVTGAEERYYESSRWTWLDLLAQNIRFGLRMLVRNPGSSAIAILTLALGIGANTAIFSLLHAILLRDLPVRQPSQLVLFGTAAWGGSTGDLPNRSWHLFSYPSYREFQQKNRVFSDVVAIDSLRFGTHGRVGDGAMLETVNVELVSGTFFQTLGVSALLGRTLHDDDDGAPGAHPVAVASYSWWQRRLGQTPSALGTKVTIRSTTYDVVGVTPKSFLGAMVGKAPDLWIPLAMEKEISPDWNGLDNNLFQSLYLFARRKPGVSMEQANANVNVLFQQMVHAYAGPQPSPKELADISHARVEVTSAATGILSARHQLWKPLTFLMTVVGLVLLIACANVANLLLARATARQREIAVRMSIGAARSRLIQQLLVESGLLGLAGAALSVPLAWILLSVLMAVGQGRLPVDISPDLPVLGFTLVLTMFTVLLFGAVPAFRATRLELASSLKAGRGAIGSGDRNRLSRALMAGQVGLSLALLTVASLFLRSLINLMHVDIGFDKQNVLITGIDEGGAGYRPGPRLENLMARIEDHVRSIPGVQASSFAFFVFNMGSWSGAVTAPGRPESPQDPEVDHNIVGADYFNVLRMPVVLGRPLNARDTAASRNVAVINEAMARAYFPGASPIGRTFTVQDKAQWRDIEVVGVAKDAKYSSLSEGRHLAAFYPHAQHSQALNSFAVRYAGDPKTLVPAIRRAIREEDAALPIGDFTTLDEVVDHSVGSQRLVTQLSSGFGVLAALLACIGIYGVMSYAISRRTNEFGVRMALGAQRRDVLWMVLRETLGLVSIGVVAGVGLALLLSRLVTSMLFGLSPTDPVAIGMATALMVAVALFSGWLPARRATRIDPTVALRYE